MLMLIPDVVTHASTVNDAEPSQGGGLLLKELIYLFQIVAVIVLRELQNR